MEEDCDALFEHLAVVVADLKRIYFTNKEPLNDDEIQIQKLCVYLEKALRYGAREKYTFKGTRKDYWNYIHDCISKDETIKYIQSIQELKTNQGKGRAFLRQALVEKSLADALQRCVINARLTKEYYVIDSVFRNNQRFQALLHSLYDLNSVEFVLPHEGYDLDRSWPSFSRKNAPVSRTNSVTSIEQPPPESDPVVILNTVINSLSRTLNKWRGVNNTEISKDNSSPKLQEMIDKMLSINEDVIKLKTISENEIIGLNKDVMRIKKEKENLVKRSEENIKETHDRYLNLQSSDKTSEHLRDVFDQLRTTESNLVKTHNEKACLENEVEKLKLLLEDSENKKSELTIENENLISNLQAIDYKLKNAKLSLASSRSSYENKIEEDSVEDSDLQPEEIGGVDAPDNAVVDEMFIDQLIRTIMRLPKFMDDDEGYDYADGMIKKYKIVAKGEQKEIMKKLAEVQKELTSSKEEKKKYEDEIETLKKEVECLLKRIDGDWDESKNTEENIRPSELIKLRLEKEELERRCQELEREIPELNVTIKTLDENSAVPGENAEAVRNDRVSKAEDIAEGESDIESRLLQEKYEKLNKENDELKGQLTSAWAEAEKCEKLNKENEELKGQLTSTLAEAEAFRVEVEIVKKDMENATSIKDSEIKTLKFELSSAEIKTETAQKELSDLKSEHEALMNDLSVRESNIKEIEKEQSQKNLAWNNEKSSLETKCKELNEKLSTYERELQILKAELAKLAQEKELDKNTKLNLTNRISNLLEERKEIESKFKADLDFIEEENKELKDHLVNITRDKHNLWHKSEILELELKSRGKERWVKDDEVTHCTNCQEQFSVTLRKHHCRLCGQIFCHACCNRWIRTHHSSKRLRSCNACADGYQESHPESVYDVVDGAANDTTSERGSFISFVNPNDLEENTGDQTNTVSDESVEDTFVVLDPKSVSSSGSFGPREEIQVKPADLRKDSIVPVVENLTQSKEESIKETVNMSLAAGQRCLLPIVICATNFELVWEFTSTPKDTGFGVAFKVNEEELDEKIQTIIPLSRYISHKQAIHGKMKIGKPGIYYLMFDNSFSRITAKYITCSFMLMLSTN